MPGEGVRKEWSKGDFLTHQFVRRVAVEICKLISMRGDGFINVRHYGNAGLSIGLATDKLRAIIPQFITPPFPVRIDGDGDGNGVYSSWTEVRYEVDPNSDNYKQYVAVTDGMVGSADNLVIEANGIDPIPNADKTSPGYSAVVYITGFMQDEDNKKNYYLANWNGHGTYTTPHEVGDHHTSSADTSEWDQRSQPAGKDGVKAWFYRPDIEEGSGEEFTWRLYRMPLTIDSEGYVMLKGQEEFVKELDWTGVAPSV